MCSNPNPNTVAIGGLSYPPGNSELSHVGFAAKTGETGSITDLYAAVNLDGYNRVVHNKTVYDNPMTAFVVNWSHELTPPLLPLQFTGYGQGAAPINYGPPPVGVLKSVNVLLSEAITRCNPQALPGALDLPRFIGELTDLKDLWDGGAKRLWKSFLDLGSALPQIADISVRRIPRKGEKLQLKLVKALDGAIDLDLARKFFVEPLLGDISKIAKGLQSLDRLAYNLAHPKPFTVRGKAEDTASAIPYSNVYTHYKIYRAQDAERQVIAWGKIVREPLVLSKWQTIRTQFNLIPRVSTGWELVRLSFIVDWFIDVGDWLSQFDGEVLDVPYQTLESGYSVKNTNTYTAMHYPFKGSHQVYNNNSSGPTLVGSRTTTSYSRVPYGINFDTDGKMLPVQTRLPSFGQVGTLVELLRAYARKR
jgi:hypothetical protein